MANVRERQSLIAKSVSEEIPSTYLVAPAPDHPLLIEGPDLLIGGEGNLVAVFIAKSAERRSPLRLSVRFVLSRFALPPHARHVFVSENVEDHAVAQRFSSDFAAVLEWGEKTNLAKIAQDRDFFGPQREIPFEISKGVQQRFADIYQITRVLRQSKERQRDGESPKIQAMVSSHTAKRTSSEQFTSGVIYTRFETSVVDRRTVNELARELTVDDFALDGGVPYPTRTPTYALAMMESFPRFRGDPEKLLRAAAFAGWAFADDEQEQNLDRIAMLLKERRRRNTLYGRYFEEN